MLCKHEVVGSIPSASTNGVEAALSICEKTKYQGLYLMAGLMPWLVIDIVKREFLHPEIIRGGIMLSPILLMIISIYINRNVN